MSIKQLREFFPSLELGVKPMSIAAEHKIQIELVKWINDNLSCSYDLPTRNKQLAHSCFDLAIEHHAAICLLCESQLYGSMYSLLRVEFEASAKGLWLQHVASNDNIIEFEKEVLPIGFGTILKLIENKLGISLSLLSLLKSRQWEIYCSFTHTGYQALVRRFNDTHTGPVNYPDQEVISALRHAGLFAVLSAVALSSMTDNQVLIESTMNVARGYGK
jgi:hypothetical protein